MERCDGDPKQERKTAEKNRRMQLKSLFCKLSSLIPKDHFSKGIMSQQDYLDHATSYIKHLRKRIESLKQRKEMCMGDQETNKEMMIGFNLPMINVRHQYSKLEVVLICGIQKRFMFQDVVSILEEEGADVVSASFSIVRDKIFHSIHCQEICPRIGLDASRVSERLKKLVL